MSPVQQFLVAITDAPRTKRSKPIVTTYAVAAATQAEAIAAFDDEVGAGHRELAMSWSCVATQSRVVGTTNIPSP